MDSEEAEIIAGANARHHQALLGFGGRGLLDHGIDAIEIAAAFDAAAGDGAEARQQALARGLHAGDGALLGFGELHQAVRGGFGPRGHVEVIAHHVQERIGADELARAQDGVAVALRLGLRHEANRGSVRPAASA